MLAEIAKTSFPLSGGGDGDPGGVAPGPHPGVRRAEGDVGLVLPAGEVDPRVGPRDLGLGLGHLRPQGQGPVAKGVTVERDLAVLGESGGETGVSCGPSRSALSAATSAARRLAMSRRRVSSLVISAWILITGLLDPDAGGVARARELLVVVEGVAIGPNHLGPGVEEGDLVVEPARLGDQVETLGLDLRVERIRRWSAAFSRSPSFPNHGSFCESVPVKVCGPTRVSGEDR